jgi:hypothetical protein
VLDDSRFDLTFRYGRWDDGSKRYILDGNWRLEGGGFDSIYRQIAWNLAHDHISHSALDTFYPTYAEHEHPMQQIASAVCTLKYGHEWRPDLEPESRSVGVTFRQDNSGWTTVVNMTHQDVTHVENWFIGEVSNTARFFLARPGAIDDYRRSQGLVDRDLTTKEDIAAILEIVTSVPPPGDTGSWFYPVDYVIIMGHEAHVQHLHAALSQAIAWNGTPADGMCLPTATVAASGAALWARQWRSFYDTDRPWRGDDDEMCWVPMEELAL